MEACRTACWPWTRQIVRGRRVELLGRGLDYHDNDFLLSSQAKVTTRPRGPERTGQRFPAIGSSPNGIVGREFGVSPLVRRCVCGDCLSGSMFSRNIQSWGKYNISAKHYRRSGHCWSQGPNAAGGAACAVNHRRLGPRKTTFKSHHPATQAIKPLVNSSAPNNPFPVPPRECHGAWPQWLLSENSFFSLLLASLRSTSARSLSLISRSASSSINTF